MLEVAIDYSEIMHLIKLAKILSLINSVMKM